MQLHRNQVTPKESRIILKRNPANTKGMKQITPSIDWGDRITFYWVFLSVSCYSNLIGLCIYKLIGLITDANEILLRKRESVEICFQREIHPCFQAFFHLSSCFVIIKYHQGTFPCCIYSSFYLYRHWILSWTALWPSVELWVNSEFHCGM